MREIIDRVMYELTRKPDRKKPTLQVMLRRLFLGFFIVMLFLTTISRALDSITIAKVTTAKVKRGVLSFIIQGDGSIEASSEQFIDLYEGVRVSDVEAEAGQYVEEGEILLCYDMADLEATRGVLEGELKKAELSLKKEQLSREEAAADTTVEAAQITLQRAELDQRMAEEDFQLAKSKLQKAAKEQYEEAKHSYTDAKEAYSDQIKERAAAIRKAGYILAEAKDELEEHNAGRTMAVEAVEAYKTAVLLSSVKLEAPASAVDVDASESSGLSGDILHMINSIDYSFSQLIEVAADYDAVIDLKKPLATEEQNIIKQYYGEKEYETHLEEIEKAKKALTRAREDARVTFISAMESGSVLTTEQKASSVRAYEDAYGALKEVIKKDRELSGEILAYGAALQSSNETEINNTYQALLSKLCKEDKSQQKALREADEAVTSAREEQENTINTWKRTIENAVEALTATKKKLAETKDKYFAILEERFDYSDELSIETANLKVAQRNLEDARRSLTTTGESKEIALQAEQRKSQLNQLNLELARMEVEEKKTSVEEIASIIAHQGKVAAPADGIIQKLEVNMGDRIDGTQKISLSLEECRFVTKVTKEEAKHLVQGDDINVLMKNNHDSVSMVIDGIGQLDAQGMVSVTAKLPKGEYKAGTTASFVVNNRSEQYDQTIPIQAVRSDAYGENYVLVIRETNTVLGRELTVERRNVRVIDKNYDTAAIEAALDPKDFIVITGSKSIEEGDRVRIDGDEE